MMLVTLQQASDHLRRDTTDDDNDLTIKVMAASGAVMEYIGSGADAFTDSAGELILDSNGEPIGVPFAIKAATLLMIGELYKNREGEQGGDIPAAFGYGYLPRAVVSLLYPYRTPRLA